MASLAASVRGAGRGLPTRPRERDGWASPAQGA